MISRTWRSIERSIDRARRVSRTADLRGFTLVELLLVISVMGLALGLSLPRVGAVREAYFATEEVREVAGFLRAAKHDAVANRTTVGLAAAVDAANVLEQRRLPACSWRTDEAAHPRMEFRDRGEVWDADVVRRTEVAGRVRLISDGPGILFFANGTSTGGEIMIFAEDGGLQCHFRIDPGTGEFIAQQGSDS
jgi:prepilin-type N-terminal cleavage/methylation domain-containing protein